MTFDAPRDGFWDLPFAEPPPVPPEPPIVPAMDGGGGTTSAEIELPRGPPLRAVPEAFPEVTVGGGGTTSCVPKSLPMMLLTNEGLAAGVGGGGITVREGSAVPLSRRRKSRGESAEGGGAMTEGAGRLSFAVLELSRSGAETGGGTTATLFICTREGDTSRLATSGAGGITLALRAGVDRA